MVLDHDGLGNAACCCYRFAQRRVPNVLYGSGHTRYAIPHTHRGVLNRARYALLIFAFDMISIRSREVRQSQA